MEQRPDYTLHIPGALRHPIPVGIAAVLLAGILGFVLRSRSAFAVVVAVLCLVPATLYVILAVMLARFTNLERRLEARERLLDAIPWGGDERVLDVGCGNGILAIGAARRLTTGSCVGVDMWTEFAGDSRAETFLENARLEGVADKVTLKNRDARDLPYPDASFDVVMSGLTIHHLKGDAGKAVAEMDRVLKPGGRMAIYDEPSTILYCSRLATRHGLDVVTKARDMIIARKDPPAGIPTG